MLGNAHMPHFVAFELYRDEPRVSFRAADAEEVDRILGNSGWIASQAEPHPSYSEYKIFTLVPYADGVPYTEAQLRARFTEAGYDVRDSTTL